MGEFFQELWLEWPGLVSGLKWTILLSGAMTASGLLGGLQVSGFWAAVWGALLYSACGLVIDSLLARFFPQ